MKVKGESGFVRDWLYSKSVLPGAGFIDMSQRLLYRSNERGFFSECRSR